MALDHAMTTDRSATPRPRIPTRIPSADDALGAVTARPVALTSAYPRPLIEAALERILASATFRRSQRHRQFLRHVVLAAIDNAQEQLKEVIIGIAVYGRELPTYDPRNDPVVRVEAGRLREKLQRFYDDEGNDEVFEITIPVGGYMPQFVARPSADARASAQRSIAILPFSNLSGHADDTTFSIGLADQLIDTLGRLPVLKVVARVSALEAHQLELPLKSVSKLLGVDHIVEGSIQRSGTRIRCIARYSRAKDGLQIWSHRFEEPDATQADLFDFQDTIADAVLAAVTASLGPAEGSGHESPARAVSTQNSEARYLFDRARYLAQQGSIDGYRQAIVLLEKAIVLDPRFAQAHSHLGAARAMLGPYVFAPTFPNFDKVKEAALRALELDPLDGEARALIANCTFRFDRDWPRGEAEFREALRIAPSSPLVHNAFSWALVFNGRYREAIQHARIALNLDPLNIALRAHNARLYAYTGDHDTAISELHAVLELDPRHLYGRLALGIVHFTRGALDLAMPCFAEILDEMPDHSSAQLHVICIRGLRGEVARGKEMLAAILGRLGNNHFTPFFVALAQACLGEREAALASLEETARSSDHLTVSIPYHPIFDRYRDDPDYLAFLARHGLRLPPH